MDDALDPFVVYFNTRIHAMKADLLPRAQFEEFLSQGNLAQMTDALLSTPYRKEVAEALTRYEGVDALEEGVSRSSLATLQSLMARANGDYKRLIEIFLQNWDLAAAKSLLRIRHQGLQGEDALATVLTGPTLPLLRAREMATVDSMDALVNALIGWNSDACKPLRRALPQYKESHDLAVLEEALDRAYFVEKARLLRASEDENARFLAEMLAIEIDRINLRVLYQHFMAKGTRDQVAARLLSGGTLSHGQLLTMAGAEDIAGAFEPLGTTRYAPLVEELFQLLQTRRFSGIERMIVRVQMKQVAAHARRNPFSISVPIDYIFRKLNEVVNLRIVARGLASNLPAGRVREGLLFI